MADMNGLGCVEFFQHVLTGGNDMDPNLFYLDWAKLFEVLSAIVVLAFLLERMLALFLESRLFIAVVKLSGVKELVALAVGAVVCCWWDFRDRGTRVVCCNASYPILRNVLPGSIARRV